MRKFSTILLSSPKDLRVTTVTVQIPGRKGFNKVYLGMEGFKKSGHGVGNRFDDFWSRSSVSSLVFRYLPPIKKEREKEHKTKK